MVPSRRQKRPRTMVPGLGNGPFIHFMKAEDQEDQGVHLTETEEQEVVQADQAHRIGEAERRVNTGSSYWEFILFLTDGSESEHREFHTVPNG